MGLNRDKDSIDQAADCGLNLRNEQCNVPTDYSQSIHKSGSRLNVQDNKIAYLCSLIVTNCESQNYWRKK